MPVVLLLLSLSYGVISIPFLMSSADSWDMVGHLSHAQMQLQMLPELVFWNPYFYSGYEQFTSYPPLLSLLVAVFSIPLGLVSAFKLVTAISWMVLPAALYFLYRGILDCRRALVAWRTAPAWRRRRRVARIGLRAPTAATGPTVRQSTVCSHRAPAVCRTRTTVVPRCLKTSAWLRMGSSMV